MDIYEIMLYAVIALVVAISSWILKVKLQRRMKRALGRKVDDSELTSINRWIEVEENEARRRAYTTYTSDNAHIK